MRVGTPQVSPCESKDRLTFIGQHIIILQVLELQNHMRANSENIPSTFIFIFLSSLTTYSPLKKFLCVACGCGNIEGFVSLGVHVDFVGM